MESKVFSPTRTHISSVVSKLRRLMPNLNYDLIGMHYFHYYRIEHLYRSKTHFTTRRTTGIDWPVLNATPVSTGRYALY